MITSDTIVSVTATTELHLATYSGPYYEAAADARALGGTPFLGGREKSRSRELSYTRPCTGAWAGTTIIVESSSTTTITREEQAVA